MLGSRFYGLNTRIIRPAKLSYGLPDVLSLALLLHLSHVAGTAVLVFLTQFHTP